MWRNSVKLLFTLPSLNASQTSSLIGNWCQSTGSCKLLFEEIVLALQGIMILPHYEVIRYLKCQLQLQISHPLQ